MNLPKSRVVVLPAAIIAPLAIPVAGSLVETTLCGPIVPSVYTFDSPKNINFLLL